MNSVINVKSTGTRLHAEAEGARLQHSKRAKLQPYPVEIHVDGVRVATIRQEDHTPPYASEYYKKGVGWIQYDTFCVASLHEVACPSQYAPREK